VTVPAKVAFCDPSIVSAVVPAPEPVTKASVPLASDARDAPLFVALPAVIVFAILVPYKIVQRLPADIVTDTVEVIAVEATT